MQKVIIDSSTINGMYVEPTIRFISKVSDVVTEVLIIGNDDSVINSYATKISSINNKIICTIGKVCKGWKLEGVLGYYIGKLVGELATKSENCMVYLFSKNTIVYQLARIITHDYIKISILYDKRFSRVIKENDRLGSSLTFFSLDDFIQNKFDRTSNINKYEVEIPPYWYKDNYTENERKIGLICKSVPTERLLPRPKFIPFESLGKCISIGTNGDIALSAWEEKGGLYEKNVEIEYYPLPEARWYIRSLKGFRRSKKQISINGNIIHSGMGKLPLKHNDCLEFGLFHFVFITDTKEEFIRYEDPKNIITSIENKLHMFVSMIQNATIPSKILKELGEDGIINWKKAYIRHYKIFIKANWRSHEMDNIRKAFLKVSNFDKLFSKINNIRNILFHPSKGNITYQEKVQLVDFYFRIDMTLNAQTKINVI